MLVELSKQKNLCSLLEDTWILQVNHRAPTQWPSTSLEDYLISASATALISINPKFVAPVLDQISIHISNQYQDTSKCKLANRNGIDQTKPQTIKI